METKAVQPDEFDDYLTDGRPGILIKADSDRAISLIADEATKHLIGSLGLQISITDGCLFDDPNDPAIHLTLRMRQLSPPPRSATP